jgi:hypothetical protein
VSISQTRHDEWRRAAGVSRSSLPGQPSLSAVLESFTTFIDHLIAAQTQLISLYLRIGSSVARGSHPARRTGTGQQLQPQDDQPALAAASIDPAPAVPTGAIQARAYEIFVQRGRRPGDPVDDWRRAEAELHSEMTG